MPIVVGISLRTAGKIYYFDPEQTEYERGERVLVETARGQELGTVKMPAHPVDDSQIIPPLKPVIRRATAADLQRERLNRERELRALEVCKRQVAKLNLPMRLIDTQFTFDGFHVLIHFLADNRVDFRELVRDLAHELHARIELRQVGVRDEAKLLGGYGVCGRQLCCSSFLDNFAPVAINTAKEQGLALNPQKISGMCGRLMCCLAFEYQAYHDNSETLPHLNAVVQTPQGAGRVTKLNVLARMVEVQVDEQPAPVWFAVDDLGGVTQRQPCCAGAEKCPRHESARPGGMTGRALPAGKPPPRRMAAPPPPPPTATPEATDAPTKARRRRRKKPAGAGQQNGGTGQQNQATTTPPPATASQETPAPARRRRPRHKARPKDPNAATPAPSDVPSGRYRPQHQEE